MSLTVVPVGQDAVAPAAHIAEALAAWVALPVVMAALVPAEVLMSALGGRSTEPTPAEAIRALLAATGAAPVLGVTLAQVRDVRGNPIRGFAERGGRAAVVSGGEPWPECRDDEGPRPWEDLLAWYALHEVGHLAGLGHCGSVCCVMHRHVHTNACIRPAFPFCEPCLEVWNQTRAVPEEEA